MITIALLNELGSEGYVPTIEIAYVRRCSSEMNKLRYVNAIWCTSRDVLIKKREINNIKIVPFIINLVETVLLEMDEFKFKNGASVSEELALFNWTSAGYIRLNICSK